MLQVLEKSDCEAMGMGSYLGVAQGAMEPPKFIHMTLSPPGGKVRIQGGEEGGEDTVGGGR
jgi:leucyl aminopeptidase